jgi:precorrin-2 C20-methyltransferase/precorrin-3B C17-methyltransferase
VKGIAVSISLTVSDETSPGKITRSMVVEFLTERISVRELIRKRRLDAAAAADLAIAIYNPASRARTWQVEAAWDVLLRHRAPDTPVVVARDVGGPEEDVRVTTLEKLDPGGVDMRCILLVGSSQTSVAHRDDGSTLVWTSRRYPNEHA